MGPDAHKKDTGAGGMEAGDEDLRASFSPSPRICIERWIQSDHGGQFRVGKAQRDHRPFHGRFPPLSLSLYFSSRCSSVNFDRPRWINFRRSLRSFYFEFPAHFNRERARIDQFINLDPHGSLSLDRSGRISFFIFHSSVKSNFVGKNMIKLLGSINWLSFRYIFQFIENRLRRNE